MYKSPASRSRRLPLCAAALVLFLCLLTALPMKAATVPTGWQEKGGARYYYDAKGKPVTGFKTIDGRKFWTPAAAAIRMRKKDRWRPAGRK